MAQRRYRRSRSKSLLEDALESDWTFSAMLAGFALFGTVVVLPIALGSNKYLHRLLGVFQPIGWLVVAFFGLIALVKYFFKPQNGRSIVVSEPRSTGIGSHRFALPAKSSEPTPPTALDQEWARKEPAIAPQPVTPTAWSLELLRSIEWKRFEELVAAYFREKGVRVETLRCGADGGVDARLFHNDVLVGIVQCKAWNGRPVGVKPVRELFGVMAHEKVGKGYFMATGDFTQEAQTFAQAQPITLVTGEALTQAIGRMTPEAQQKLLNVATEGDYMTPSCPSCGTKMVTRESDKGRFWGCKNYPRCRQKFFLARTS